MSSATQLVLLFCAGLVCGVALAYVLFPAQRKSKDLQKERDQAVAALTQHQEKVDRHFLRTAELVNQLTVSYRAVHEQLSEGARSLCTQEGRDLAMSQHLDTLPGYPGQQPNAPQQPLDYAPAAQGTLDETYGFEVLPEPAELFTPVDDLGQSHKKAPLLSEPPRDYADGCTDQGCTPSDASGRAQG